MHTQSKMLPDEIRFLPAVTAAGLHPIANQIVVATCNLHILQVIIQGNTIGSNSVGIRLCQASGDCSVATSYISMTRMSPVCYFWSSTLIHEPHAQSIFLLHRKMSTGLYCAAAVYFRESKRLMENQTAVAGHTTATLEE